MPARVRKSKNENLIMKGKLAGKVAVLALYHRLQMRYGLGVFRVANALQTRCNRVGSGFAGQLNSRAGSKHTDSDFAGNLNSRCGLKTHRSIGKCLLRECLLRARGVPALRCIARRSVPPSATGGSARAPKDTKKDHHGTPAAGAAAAENETPA